MSEYVEYLDCEVCGKSLVFDEGSLTGLNPDTYACDGCGRKYAVSTYYKIKKIEGS